MTPLNKEQKESVLRRMSFALTELKDIEELKNITYEVYNTDRPARRNLERLIENLVNATIDITKILLASEPIELPATYREAIIKLADVGIIDKELAANLSEIIRARNVLAHQYLDIRWSVINEFLQDGYKLIDEFLKAVTDKIK